MLGESELAFSLVLFFILLNTTRISTTMAMPVQFWYCLFILSRRTHCARIDSIHSDQRFVSQTLLEYSAEIYISKWRATTFTTTLGSSIINNSNIHEPCENSLSCHMHSKPIHFNTVSSGKKITVYTVWQKNHLDKKNKNKKTLGKYPSPWKLNINKNCLFLRIAKTVPIASLTHNQ